MDEKKLSIGFIGNLGTGNLGDEASLAAALQILRAHFPHARFYAFSNNDTDTRLRHGIDSFPAYQDVSFVGLSRVGADLTEKSPMEADLNSARWKRALQKMPPLFAAAKSVQSALYGGIAIWREAQYMRRSLAYVDRLDWIGAAGGGQYADNFTGPWGYPYMLLRSSLLAKLRRKRFFVIGVGAAPLNSSLSKRMARWSLRLAHHRSFRDATSRNIAQQLGIRSPDNVIPDLVYALDVRPFLSAPVPPNDKLVALSLFPHGDPRYWPENRIETYHGYLSVMGEFTAWLLEKGYEVVFFPTQVRADPRTIQDLLEHLKATGVYGRYAARIGVPRIETFEELFNALAPAHSVVCTRFHGCIMSFIMEKPLLAIPNQPKMVDMMADMDLTEFAVDIHSLSVEKLAETFLRLQENRAHVVATIQNKVADKRARVQQQFKELFVGK